MSRTNRMPLCVFVYVCVRVGSLEVMIGHMLSVPLSLCPSQTSMAIRGVLRVGE